MNWFDYFLIGWWLFGTVLTVAFVGKPRGPLTAGTAAFTVGLNAAFVVGLLWSHGALS